MTARDCILCHREAVKLMTWVNDAGSGIGGGAQGGPMCEPCMSMIWDALSRFPVARETVTIWPVTAAADPAQPAIARLKGGEQ